MTIERIGNFVLLFNLLKNFGACFSSLKEKSILLVVYIPEFAADSNDVRMTALIIDAANAIPIRSKTIVNGL